ncbi:hypothetical protein ACROYT_G007191 [Oculina patagonica]
MTCELLPTDLYNASQNFENSEEFDHWSIVTPCLHSPCKNDGTCVPDYNQGQYVCLCPVGYHGTNCQLLQTPPALGKDKSKPGLSCKDIANRQVYSQGDGEYWIAPDGSNNSFVAYCDMTTDGDLDIFRVAIHDNVEIPTVQKFVYLKSLLSNEAAGYIANIKTEEANYEVAVQRLTSRYGKDEVQKNCLMTKLADMKPLEQSNKAMRDALDELFATVRALEVQGVTTEQYGSLLMPLIESKLPKDWRLVWAREKAGLSKEDVTFSKLLKFLEQELEIRESADQPVEVEQHQSIEKEKTLLPTVSGLMAKSVTCTFCKGPHSPKQCSVPMSVDDRFKKVKEIRACFSCARRGHRMASCGFRKPCPCGRGSHIPQLCKTGGVKIPEVQNPTPSTSNPPNHPSWNPAAPPYTPANQSHLPPSSQPPNAAVMSSAKNADIKTAGVMMRTVCVVIGDVAVRALVTLGPLLQ